MYIEEKISKQVSDGNLVGAIESVRDITERKKMEEELSQHRDNLEELVKERTSELKKVNEQLQREIMDRMHLEKALRESEEKYRAIFENTGTATTIIDEDNSIIMANTKVMQLSGYPKEECVGRSWTEFVVAEDLERLKNFHRLRRIKEDLAPRSYEFRYIDKRGKVKDVLATVAMIPGTKKSVISLLDISDRKRAEEELRLSEERFSKAFNASPNPMSITTLDEGRYLDVNESFLKLSGYRREEVMNRTVSDISIWAKSADRVKMGQILKAQGTVRNMETEFRTKTGETCVVLISAEIIDFQGEQYLLCVGNDITERKQLEKEMARLDRLNLIGEMAAGIAHEIRNPMTIVRGFLQMFWGNETFKEEKEHFDLMIDELDRANSIITEFLSLARNKVVNKKPLNLNVVLENLFPLIQADGLKFDKYVNMELEKVPELLMDEGEIRQVILNLVRNGFEATPPGGSISIKTYIKDSEAVLSVLDKGMGIEPSVLEKIGTPFVTTKDNGTGLGLAVCYSIAARHNAAIKVETSSGGTTFFVRFKLPTNP